MKKIPIVAILLALVLNYILPITNVFAEGYVITFTATGEHEMVNDGGHLKIDGQYVDLRNGDETIGEVTCTSTTACTITVSTNTTGNLNYNSANKFTLFMQGHEFNMDHNFNANENIAVQDYVSHQEPGVEPGPDGPRFDGRAVVLWSCGSGDTGVCFHEFSVIDPEHCDPENPTDACNPEIGNFNDGNSTFFRDTYVTADNKPNEHFDVNAKYRAWYLTDEFNRWQGLYELATGNPVDWNTLEPEIIMGEPNQHVDQIVAALGASNYDCGEQSEESCVNEYAAKERGEIWTHKLQPVGEPTEANAYVSYGDRNFKVVIYNSEYRGITTTADFGGLHYYPASWADPFLRTDQYDVSATNENNPKYLESILLENTINIDVLPYNNYELTKIEALDIPVDAVTITKVNSRKFQVEFSSNFYDHVVFKLTDTNGDESYVQIKRYTIDAWIRDGNTLSADFYYDMEKDYDDFVITAKIMYYDGTVENVTLEAVEDFRDGLGNPVEGYFFDENAAGGKGLKRSVFEYYIAEGADRTVKDVYLNAEYVGSSASTYAGAYSGSGEGTPANLYHPGEEE